MAGLRISVGRAAVLIAVLIAGTGLGVGLPPVSADVSAVRGSAFGYSLTLSLFGGPARTITATPSVALSPDASNSPQSATAPSGSAAVDPATVFTSDKLDVSTRATTGPTGSVTSSTDITKVNKSQSEALTATRVQSTCTASPGGVSGSTTVTAGTVQTDSGDDNPANTTPDHPAVTVPVPATPAPNTSFDGHVHIGNVTDTFRYVFNEQTTNPDGSITVNAAHMYLLGPTAKGDLIIGQVICGVTATASTTTTGGPGATTTTTAGATTTTTSAATTTTAGATTTTAPAATTTTTAGGGTPTVTGVGGGAYGFFASVGLFGGPASAKGPTPTVELPAGGSATPITRTEPSGSAQYGPATIFSSDKLDATTQGTTGPTGSVTSSASAQNVNRSGQESFTAASLTSTCTASQTGATGSTKLAGAKLVTSQGANLDSEADDVVVQLPADPTPNTSYNGKIESVGDTFRLVVNEQQTSAGSITVNGAHLYLLGPVAVGELIVGQSRCSLSGSSAGGSGTLTGASTGGGGSVATTGTEAARITAMALNMIVAGWAVTLWSSRRRWRRRTIGARDPWASSWPRRPSARWTYSSPS